MKRLLIVLGFSISILLGNCNNQKYKSLEAENKQLRQQLDSCNLVVRQQNALSDSASKIAIRQREIALANAEEARKQAEIARKYIERQKQLKVKK